MAAPDLLLAVDQGTTSSRAALVDAGGARLAVAQEPHHSHHPAPGLVEHDPLELLDAVARCVRRVLDGVEPARLAGLGITNQRETVVLWERDTGRPVSRAIVWQDTRTAELCAELRAQGAEELVRARTGLPLQPYFSATKLGWLLDHVPGARDRAQRGELAAGTIESWLAWSCTGGPGGGAHLTDVTNASRTLLFDTARLAWDEELLELFGIPRAVLPHVVPSWRAGGHAETRRDGPLGVAVPLLALLGDQQAALVGQACLEPGDAECTYGTGAFLLVNAGRARPEPGAALLASPAYQPAGEPAAYCVEGSMAVAGSAVAWLADGLGVLPEPAASSDLAASVASSDGVRVVPGFQGLYAPWWDDTARGAIVGLTLHSTRAHVVRATLEALAFQTRAVLDTAEDGTGVTVPSLRAGGGVTANRFLLQTLADVLGRPVERTVDPEGTLRGVGIAAGLAAGMWEGPAEIAALRGAVEPVEPVWDAARREEEYADWLRAVDRSRR